MEELFVVLIKPSGTYSKKTSSPSSSLPCSQLLRLETMKKSTNEEWRCFSSVGVCVEWSSTSHFMATTGSVWHVHRWKPPGTTLANRLEIATAR
jgi:hypothetical protein